MKRKIVAFVLSFAIAIGNLYGIFTNYEDGNVVADIPGEHNPDANTVGLWHFNESSGPQANDSSGNNNDGTLYPSYPSDSPQWVDGRFGKALEFDGVNDFVEIPDSNSLDITDEITMEAWVKPYSFSTIPYIISKKKTDTAGLYALIITDEGKAKAFFDTPNHITAWDPIPLDEWTYLAATFNGSVKRIYINGVENNNETYSHIAPTSTHPLRIGSPGSGDNFDGIIDEVRLSNVGRTAEEIADYYRSTSTLYVDDSYTGFEPDFGITKFKVIQNAIDNATIGNTIFVFNGTYYENVVVNKTINLTGENMNTTIIDGQGLDTAIYITADWVNITGVTIKSFNTTTIRTGVILHITENCSIMNNNISNNDKGVYLWYSNNNIVSENIISNNTRGILNYFSDYTSIAQNTLVDNEYAIYIQSSKQNEIYGNSMISNGIFIRGDFINEWNSHTIDSLNSVNHKPVYYWRNKSGGIIPQGAGQVILANCSEVTVENQKLVNGSVGVIIGFSSNIFISNNNVSNQSYGFYIYNCQFISIIKCNIIHNIIGGITIRKSNGSEIRENWISNNNDGIYHYQCSKSNIIGNIFLNNRDALYVHGGTHNIISFNNFSQNSVESLLCVMGNHTKISSNIVSYNYIGLQFILMDYSYVTGNKISYNEHHGINFQGSHNNTISGNNVTNNSKGIYFSQSKDNIVIGNDFYSNFEDGIYLYLSNNNKIHHNNLINNYNQSYDDTYNGNQWDNGYPSGGNYWSDFDETSEGAYDDYKGVNQDIIGWDGIVDNGTGAGGGKNPYEIDDDSHDNYPLIWPYQNYMILKQGWNFVSIPFIQQEQNLIWVLESIDGLYDAVQWYSPNDIWKHNKVSKPYGNDLFELNESMGFWIHITNPGDTIFLYNGTQPSANQTIQLHGGWNMVGYPSLIPYNRTEGLNNLTFNTHVDSIWTYNAATQNYKELTASDFFEIGKGYYIHAKEECTWVVPL